MRTQHHALSLSGFTEVYLACHPSFRLRGNPLPSPTLLFLEVFKGLVSPTVLSHFNFYFLEILFFFHLFFSFL